MSDRHTDQKTNIDDVFIPGWLMWLVWWSAGVGFIVTILFLITALGFKSPVNDVYFSPTAWGSFVHRIATGNEQ